MRRKAIVRYKGRSMMTSAYICDLTNYLLVPGATCPSLLPFLSTSRCEKHTDGVPGALYRVLAGGIVPYMLTPAVVYRALLPVCLVKYTTWAYLCLAEQPSGVQARMYRSMKTSTWYSILVQRIATHSIQRRWKRPYSKTITRSSVLFTQKYAFVPTSRSYFIFMLSNTGFSSELGDRSPHEVVRCFHTIDKSQISTGKKSCPRISSSYLRAYPSAHVSLSGSVLACRLRAFDI